ncbi:MAG: hypothetical protein GEU98_22135 [Pseudonocardiaceae bacterium]|nr:hypothetical protein [Pseudonocardiaceae bacterium]
MNALPTTTEAPARLPARPKLLAGLPVLGRRGGELQIGLDPRHAMVISGLPKGVAEILRQLDGSRTSDAVLDAAGEHAGAMCDVLAGLTEAGLLEDAAGAPRPAPCQLRQDAVAAVLRAKHNVDVGRGAGRLRRTGDALIDARARGYVRVIGDGRLAIGIACSLAGAGVGRVRVQAEGRVRQEDLGCGYTSTDLGMHRSRAAARAIRAAATGTPRHRSRSGPELVVLADAAVPLPDLVHPLVAECVPHLLVHVREGRGLVGPLVVPGRTSCLRCADLHRADRDPCWPTVAGQLAGRALPADLAGATATVAFAAGQVLALLERTPSVPPPVWNAQVEVDPFACAVRRTAWPPHPACGCCRA